MKTAFSQIFQYSTMSLPGNIFLPLLQTSFVLSLHFYIALEKTLKMNQKDVEATGADFS